MSAHAARRRRDRLDRRVVLLHPARPRPGAAEGAEGGRRRRVLGRPRRRLLPLAEVHRRTAAAAGAAALVQVGGVHDLALGLRAAGRPLLARRRHEARRPDGRRPQRLAGGGAVGGWARARLAHLRPRLPRPDRGPARRDRGDRARGGLRVRGGRALRRAGVVSPGRRDARDDHGRERLLRDHPGAPRARPGEAGGPRAEPAAGPAREAALGAQQLPDAAGRVHDARRPLSARLRKRPRLARPARDLRDRGGDPALLQPLALGQARLVDPRRGGRRGRRARDRARARRARLGSGAERRARRSRSRRSAARAVTPAPQRRSASSSGTPSSCSSTPTRSRRCSSRARCRRGTRPG